MADFDNQIYNCSASFKLINIEEMEIHAGRLYGESKNIEERGLFFI